MTSKRTPGLAMLVVLTLSGGCHERGSVDEAAGRMHSLVEATAIEFGLADHLDEIETWVGRGLCEPTDDLAAEASLDVFLEPGEFDSAQVARVSLYWEGVHGNDLVQVFDRSASTHEPSVGGRLSNGTQLEFRYYLEAHSVLIRASSRCYRNLARWR